MNACKRRGVQGGRRKFSKTANCLLQKSNRARGGIEKRSRGNLRQEKKREKIKKKKDRSTRKENFLGGNVLAELQNIV